MTSTLREFGLTHVQFVLLASLWWLTETAGEKPNQRRLAEFAATDPMMTSQVLRTLETKGLILRSTQPADSRAHQLAVTDAGARLASETIGAVEEADGDFFGKVSGRRDSLLDYLRILAG